jgi:2-polyprenyl-3-methyl-5-hydroxy-6-metoxy-1,4-benzoquinol methylase
MFKNALNRSDLRHLANRVRRTGFRKAASQLFGQKGDRVTEFWSTVEHEPVHAWNVPSVLQRRNALITGDESTSYVDYFVEAYLADRGGLRALSVGCGDGSRECVWARTGQFARIDACDISSRDVDLARRRAEAEGLEGVLRFEVADAYELAYEPDSFDLIIGEDSLHHLTPLDDLFSRFEQWLRPDGMLFVNEYVGPRRLQMRSRQLEAANAMITLLPESLRREWQTGNVKRRVEQAGWLRVYLKDPSEAVESDRIIPLLRQRFDVIEEKPYGEAIVDPVLLSIAPNFMNDDPLAQKALDLMFAAEGLLMETGEIESVRTVLICRKRTPLEVGSA